MTFLRLISLLLVLHLGPVLVLRAQFPADSLRLRYDRETIFLHNSRAYFKNYRTYPIGFSGLAMRREFENSPQGLLEFERFRKNRTTGRVLSLLGAAATVVGPQLLLSRPSRSSLNASLYLVFGGLAVSSGGAMLNQRAYNQLQYAVWLRNRDVLVYDGPPPVR